jgi:tRNA A-37 threonylcarbamoyl transferase component Bud32
MTTALPPTRNSTLPPDVALRLDQVCDRFKAAWDAGTPPRLEDYLGDVAEPDRPALLRELIPLDVHFRQQQGEKPTAPEYQARFPWAALGWLGRELGEAGPAQAGRYQLFEEIGRGGMGKVHKCYDPLVDRDQAIKLLREQLLDQPELVRRFLEEGRINGRLQHPGIVPVYDLGELPDRRPFFTMKLVEGRTLAALLKERTDPGQDLPRFLTIFEQICQTLAYTHSHQVIHRDLKPANVMVGAFGEVQVMDWGLAKVLDRQRGNGAAASAPAGAGVAGSSSPEDTPADLPTQEGQRMGTAPYVPPEQARGEVKWVDQRSDVFGLGAILCEILTGQPPFTGKNQNEVFAKARACDHAEALARLDGCGADTELVRLAKVCLAPQPEDRPSDAGVVAQQVAAYLAGVQERLRATELERAAAEARAQEAKATAAAEHRARRRARALALALVLGAGVSTFFAVMAYLWAQDAEDNAKVAGAETIKAQKNEREANKAREQAEATLARGLLRPLGHQPGPIKDVELDALWELAESPSDRVRLLFVANALETPDKARQFGNRGELALHAALGLDRQRRQRVEDILLDRLRDDSASLVLRGDLARGIAKANPGPELAGAAARLLSEALAKEPNAYDPSFLAQGLAALAARLGPEEAGMAARLLSEAMAKQKNVDVRSLLAQALAAVAARLGPEEAARYAAVAAHQLSEELAKEPDAKVRSLLAQRLAAVAARLGPVEAIQRSLLAAQAITEAPVPHPFAGLAALALAAQPLPSRFSTQELVDLLKMPTCVGPARDVILQHLGERYHRPFADQWEFVEYAEKHLPDLDLKSPPKRPQR